LRTAVKSLLFLLSVAGTVHLSAAQAPQDDPLHDAAEKGDVPSQLALADAFFFGRGRPVNPALAAYWYRKAAEKGSAEAQYNLAACFEFGWGVHASRISACDWYAKAAAQGLNRAIIRRAELLFSGLPDETDGQTRLPGIPPAPAEAIASLRKIQDDPVACRVLASLLLGSQDP